MGFRSSIVPTRLATNAEEVLDDTRNYAAGASAEFKIPPDLFGGFDPLRFELRSLDFAIARAQIRIYPPDVTPNGTANESLIHSDITDFRGFLPIQPIGGHLVATVRNLDSFAADIQLRAVRLRGVRDFADLTRSAAAGPNALNGQNVNPAATGAINVEGSATFVDRLRAIVTLDQTSDVVVRWRAASNTAEFTIDETIATGVAAGEPTVIDRPWQGDGRAQIRVTNTAGIAGSLDWIAQAIPR